MTLINCVYCDFETSTFLFLTKKQKESNTIPVDLIFSVDPELRNKRVNKTNEWRIFFKSWSVLGQQSKSAVSWNSKSFCFRLTHRLWECSFLVANISFLSSTVLCCILPPSLSARCSTIDHLLLTPLIENSSLLCALWPFVCFTLASFYKGRILCQPLRRRQRHKRSRFRRCSQLSSCCLTALNISEICWRWKIRQLDRNNDMMSNISARIQCHKKKGLKNYRMFLNEGLWPGVVTSSIIYAV